MRNALFFLVTFPILFSCSNDKSALSVVPLSAEGIAIIDIQEVGSDAFHGEASFEEIELLLSEIQLGKQNEFKKFIKSLSKLPISLFSKAALFTYSMEEKRILGISIPLRSEALSTIQELGSNTVITKKGARYILFDTNKINKGIALIEENYILLLKAKLDSKQLIQEVKRLKKLKKSESVENNSIPDHDCYLLTQSNGVEVKGSLNFENGKIAIKLKANFDEENPLDTLLNTPTTFNYDTSAIAVVQSNINPHLLNKIPFLPLVIKNTLDTTDVFHGPISMTLQGVELRSRHFITYEEDEEFNLIQKSTVKIDTVNKIHGYIEGNTQLFSPFLNYFLSLNLLKKEKSNWYSSPVLLDQYQIFPQENKVFFSSYEHDFADYSHTIKSLAHIYINIQKIHDLENNNSFWKGFTLEIDPIEHFYVNQRLKSLDISLPDNSNININIDFKNENENGLIECLHILKEISNLKKEKIRA